MADVKTMLTKRFEKNSEKLSKMHQLASMSSQGDLSSFSGVFKVTKLTDMEKDSIQQILLQYSAQKQEITKDLEELSQITSEVRAINNQAIILHGERIKKAQTIFSFYKDGAFSAWLMATYGNRQSPYNFLQYYEFYMTFPKPVQQQIDTMPKQAIYTLASRTGSLKAKESFLLGYKGETKDELLTRIREIFPLSDKDKRKEDVAAAALQKIQTLLDFMNRSSFQPTKDQKDKLLKSIDALKLVVMRAK